MTSTRSSYIHAYESGKLAQKIKAGYALLESCRLCPRRCGINRMAGEKGVCNVGSLPMVSSSMPHFGEERPLVGFYGSGTIFLTNCNLKCLFCQNYDISHLGHGEEVSVMKLAEMMVALQRQGCHNINFVTPTHQAPQILDALSFAIDMGLEIPLVYNSGGYDDIETIRLLDGVFDIYMPDFKYGDDKVAKSLSNAPCYVEAAKSSIKEMHRQVGDLVMDSREIAVRGLLLRHLILPERLAGTREVMRFIAKEISTDTYVNIMDQYRPCFNASDHPPMDRRITKLEYDEAVRIAIDEGLWRFDG